MDSPRSDSSTTIRSIHFIYDPIQRKYLTQSLSPSMLGPKLTSDQVNSYRRKINRAITVSKFKRYANDVAGVIIIGLTFVVIFVGIFAIFAGGPSGGGGSHHHVSTGGSGSNSGGGSHSHSHNHGNTHHHHSHHGHDKDKKNDGYVYIGDTRNYEISMNNSYSREFKTIPEFTNYILSKTQQKYFDGSVCWWEARTFNGTDYLILNIKKDGTDLEFEKKIIE